MHRLCTVVLFSVAAGFFGAGCKSDTSEPKASSSSGTMDAPKVAAKDMTHTIVADAKYGMTYSGAKDAGMLKKGTNVLLMAPGSTAQVMTPNGKTVYVDNAMLKPLGTK